MLQIWRLNFKMPLKVNYKYSKFNNINLKTRKEGETKILRLIEDKTALLRTEVQKETRLRVDAIENIH
jgi:hypothetical protein